jgi:branched-chain amino acid:cation transporter, LIVCS family
MNKRSFDVVLVGFALFAMFFGAGNLIFPPYMGFLAGTLWSVALMGFLITGIGMPLMGVIASARAGGSVEHLAGRVGKRFARLMSIVVILAIGPLLAIPRTAAVTFEMGIKPNFPWAPPALGSVVFFAITLFFALNETTVIDKIGKFLTPFLLATLLLIIVKGIATPISGPMAGSLANPFTSGFKEGYQTMDAMASIVFAEIVIAALVFKGYARIGDQVKMASKAAVIAAVGLGSVYGGLMYLGASSGGAFPADVERTTLLIGIAERILGGGGKAALGLAVSLACLTTSIGLTATVADYFSNITKEKLSYKLLCVITVVFSGVFATVGVTKIVQIAVPLLVLVYPVAICLILLTIVGRKAVPRQVYVGAVAGALAVSIFEALTAAGLPVAAANAALSVIPLGEAGFPWIVPAVAGALVGGLVAGRGRGPV